MFSNAFYRRGDSKINHIYIYKRELINKADFEDCLEDSFSSAAQKGGRKVWHMC